MSCPQGCLSLQHSSALECLACCGRSGCAEQGDLWCSGIDGRAPGSVYLSFGNAGAMPMMSPCHTAQPGPSSKGSLITTGQGPGGL